MKRALRTVREFMLLSIPLSREQDRILQTSLEQDGCREPIIAWGDIILDGHKRYRICTQEGIDYCVEEKSFSSTDEAVSWICRRRLSQFDNKTPAYRYLVGSQYIALKEIYREIRKQPEDQRKTQLNPVWDRTSLYVAEEFRLNRATVESYGRYATDMRQIAEKSKDLFDAILAEDIQLSMSKIHEYAGLAESALQKIYMDLPPKNKRKILSGKNSILDANYKAGEVVDKITLSVGIKEMPAYDPDMELRSLMLTVQTWTASIARVEKKTDQATGQAKEQLCRSLIQLEKQIDEILEVMGYG